MKVEVELALGDALDLEFARWHEGNPGAAHQALLLGHFVMTRGIDGFYKAYYAANSSDVRDREWQDRLHAALAASTASHEGKVVHLKDRVRDLEEQLRAARGSVDAEAERRSLLFK